MMQRAVKLSGKDVPGTCNPPEGTVKLTEIVRDDAFDVELLLPFSTRTSHRSAPSRGRHAMMGQTVFEIFGTYMRGDWRAQYRQRQKDITR
jgi:hypothetical protein